MTPEDQKLLLDKILATAELAVDYGRSANERLGRIEQRLALIEKHVGLNGNHTDTEPSPVTEPENERPSG